MHHHRDCWPSATAALAATTVVALAIGLQGCGGGGGDSPTPTPSPPPGWNLWPIEVKGTHLYNSHTGKEFHPKGIGFPNVGKSATVNEWIAVLQRIKNLSSEINAIRIYEPPSCAVTFGSTCFEPFMREADKLGVYVLVPGSGTDWGYFPGLPSGCDPPVAEGLQGCYEGPGKVLGFGRTVVLNFHYPNTLAIVLANEVEQNAAALPVLKAYARDLKIFMGLCNSNSESPTQGQMRQIPLMYAATDEADHLYDEADYLFCGSQADSIDIYGLNNERWVSDAGGKTQYDQINAAVKARQWPGAFMHSEEGGPYGSPYPAVPTWQQVPTFFSSWPSINGFFGYVYSGHPQYNMFDGPFANSTELPDGKAFFSQIAKSEANPPDEEAGTTKTPECATSIILKDGVSVPLIDYNSAMIYSTGENSWAVNCPKPLGQANDLKVVV